MVMVAQTVDVFLKKSFLDKLSKRILLKIGYAAGIKGKPLIKLLQKRRRQNHVTDADRRCQRLGKCIHVNDAV